MARREAMRRGLGVLLLVCCLVLAIQLRSRQSHEKRAESGEASVVKTSDEPLSQATVLRVVQPGQAAHTFFRDTATSPWQLEARPDFRVDEEAMARVIALLDRPCTSPTPSAQQEGQQTVLGELLVGKSSFAIWRREDGVVWRVRRGEGVGCRLTREEEALLLFTPEQVGHEAPDAP